MSPSACKKDVKNDYDPQIGAAAQANAALAERSLQFSEDYFTKYVAPALQQATRSQAQESANQKKLFDLNYSQATKARDRYEAYGIPAENSYYQMVRSYSEPAEQERQAALALGDVRTAAGSTRGQMLRQFASLGINPTSPAAIAAMADNRTAQTSMEAGAMNRARNAARSLGMQLKGDAANFGRGGGSNVMAFGNSASANSMNGWGINSGAIGAYNAGAQVPMAGMGQAMQGYQANLNAYTQLGQTSMQANAASGGIMGGLGSLAGAALGAAGAAGGFGKLFSDRRLKQEIVLLGVTDSGIPVYEFQYIWGGPRRRGFMADDVEKIMPEAVSERGGYKVVNYNMVM